jgi:hypothetical protein
MNRSLKIILKCVASALVGCFMFYYAALISGGGHGWNSGALALLALIPVAACSVFNALSSSPKVGLAKILLVAGLLIIVALVVVTFNTDQGGFQKVWRQAVESFTITLLIFLAYFGWIGITVIAAVRLRYLRKK